MGKYMIIRKQEYDLMKKAIINNDEYIKLIKINNKELAYLTDNVATLSDAISIALKKLNLVEKARKSNAGKIGALTANYNKEKNKAKELLNTIDIQKEYYENKVSELEGNVKDLEIKLEESMSDKYLVRKLPAGRRPKTQTMKLKSCTVQSNIARKMFGDSK